MIPYRADGRGDLAQSERARIAEVGMPKQEGTCW